MLHKNHISSCAQMLQERKTLHGYNRTRELHCVILKKALHGWDYFYFIIIVLV